MGRECVELKNASQRFPDADFWPVGMNSPNPNPANDNGFPRYPKAGQPGHPHQLFLAVADGDLGVSHGPPLSTVIFTI
jgi:hypothetical protein